MTYVIIFRSILRSFKKWAYRVIVVVPIAPPKKMQFLRVPIVKVFGRHIRTWNWITPTSRVRGFMRKWVLLLIRLDGLLKCAFSNAKAWNQKLRKFEFYETSIWELLKAKLYVTLNFFKKDWNTQNSLEDHLTPKTYFKT